MKKLLALLLALAMIFALVACGTKTNNDDANDDQQQENPDDQQQENPDDQEPEAPETTDINAAVFWYDYSDAFLATVRDALGAQLSAAGVTYNDYDAKNVQATQNEQIDTAISTGANLLIVNAVETGAIDAAQAIVDKAKAANIPIIFFNREVDDTVINSYDQAAYVGTRAAEAGEMQGQMAGDYIVANYDTIDRNQDGNISYIMMKGQLGNPEAEQRTQFAVEFCNTALTEAGKPELVYYDSANSDKFQATDWLKNKAFEAMTTALSTNPMDGDNPIEVVFANNDEAALGCVEALNNAGYNTGDGDSIPVFGVDYTSDAQTAIEAGKMTGSILQSADGMAEAIAFLVANVQTGQAIFTGADTNEAFKTVPGVAKIQVPYQIKTAA